MSALVCVIAKMENHYIREWVEHYKSIGFANAIIYDNNDVDGECFDEVISDYITDNYVIVKNYRGKHSQSNLPSYDTRNLQIAAYCECFNEYRTKYDWILFVDADEFLMFEEYSTIDEFLSDKRYSQVNAIKFAWKYYDDNSLVTVNNNDYSLVKRFTHFNPINNQNNQGKCIIRTSSDVCINSAHVFGIYNHKNANLICVNPSGNTESTRSCILLGSNANTKHCVAWINHYRYKTIEEYVTQKMIRLYPDQSEVTAKRTLSINSFFSANAKTIEKQNVIDKYLEKSKGTIKNKNVKINYSTITLQNNNKENITRTTHKINTILNGIQRNRMFKKI